MTNRGVTASRPIATALLATVISLAIAGAALPRASLPAQATGIL